MTAQEVLARSAELSSLLGSAYGRLQSELLTPLIERSVEIMEDKGLLK